MLSKIEQVEMLIALGKGDKYRLMHIREILERGKELYISDKDFLQNLVKTHLKDRIYQARVVSTTEKPKQFCENCASEISADEMFCTNCGAVTQAPSSPPTLDVPEPTPKPKKKSRQQELEEYESKHIAKSGKQHTAKGFTITDSGEIGQTSTKKTVRRKSRIKSKPTPRQKSKKKSRQQELEEYEKKHLNEPQTTSSWKAYDVKAKKSVEIQNPKVVKMKNGKWAIKGTSPITGINVFRIVGNKKPNIYSEETVESPKVESPKVKKKQTASAEKTKASPKAKKVVSRYYRPPAKDNNSKVKRSKSKKSNKFCEECGSKIAAKDMFCTNCGAKR